MSSDTQLASVLTTFTIALMHTLIPSHWLCFVLVGRANRWGLGKTLLVTVSAGLAHAGITLVLSAVAVMTRTQLVAPEELHWVSAGVLGTLGVLYVALHFLHMGHHHQADEHIAEKASIVSLLLSVTFSPCTLVIPVFFGVAAREWPFFVLLGLVLVGTTVGVMSFMVALSFYGAERLKFEFIDRFEKLIIGAILGLMGASLLLFH